MIKSKKSYLILIISNLLISVIFFEVLSRVFLSDYMDSKLKKIIHRYVFDEDIDEHSVFTSNGSGKIPHPYLGYIRINKDQQIDIINERNKNINGSIGIFGGSVAEDFYIFNKKSNLLEKSLKEKLNPKNIFEIKNYSLAGYKQPQHLISAILFRPKVKVTISIEGYNEIQIPSSSPHYYPFPAVSRLYYSGLKIWSLYIKAGKIRIYQKKLKTFIEKDQWFKSVQSFFKILYFLSEKSIANLEKKLIHQKNNKKKLLQFKPVTLAEKIIYWLERSCEQQNFLAARGVKAYFFFQPSPHIPQSKKELTDHEKQMIKDYKYEVREIWRKKHLVEDTIKAYLLVRKLIKTENLTFNLVDMSQVFLDESRQVFQDGSCHLNQLGNSLLTQKIAEVVNKTYFESKKPKLCRDNFRGLIEKLNSDL